MYVKRLGAIWQEVFLKKVSPAVCWQFVTELSLEQYYGQFHLPDNQSRAPFLEGLVQYGLDSIVPFIRRHKQGQLRC